MAIRLSPEALRQVRSIDDAITFLADALDWPLESADLDEASFDYTAEELGIPAEHFRSVTSLRQLRPLTADQPWGIFFVEFGGGRLPVVALRRLLGALVQRKRQMGAERKTWALDDLLFVVTTDSGDSVELHLMAFFDAGNRVAEIRSLPWRPRHSPPQHLRRLADELLPRLAWPQNEAVDQWRAAWRGAFSLRHGEAITAPARLAERMAETAHVVRSRVAASLDQEGDEGPFAKLLEDVQRELVADVDADRFADMCAQTLVYGTLASRITDPHAFGASPTLASLPLSNPFLTAFFEQVHDHAADVDLGETGLDALVADLRETNVEGILDQFGSTAKGGDPVIHFYEQFLQSYDRKIRHDAGAFYTPQPVVHFMVAAVDEVLRTTFGLPAGIADDASWAQVAERTGLTIPIGVAPEDPFVQMLDPATGTGTFLVEWLRRARTSYLATQRAPEWSEHLREHVLPSMHAFEVMLAPYAIAHLKVALELNLEEDDPARSTILLTDALDHPAASERFAGLDDPVAVEGRRAAAVKRETRFSVVVGNPPYDREQREAGDERRRKGGIVRFGVPGVPPLMEAVLGPLRAAGMGQHAKNAYNDYVYFWRYATWQATQRRPGPGVVAFITAASYLDGKSLAGLRHHLRGVFDELWVVDLGGEGRGANVEENVFDIRTPVAIAIGVRHRGASECTVRYLRIPGTREEKFDALQTLTLDPGRFASSTGVALEPLTPRSAGTYEGWPELTDLLPWVHSGSQLKRTWPIAAQREVLEQRWEAMVEAPVVDRPMLLKESRDRKADKSVRPLLARVGERLVPLTKLSANAEPEGLERYGYRSFDRQWVLADNRVGDFMRPDLWAVRGPRQVFLATLTSTPLGGGPALTATPYVPDMDHFRGSYGAKNIMPLWRDRAATRPNVPRGLLSTLSERLGVRIGIEDLAAYLHAILGTGAFTSCFAAELKAAGPAPVRVPMTADAELFAEAVALGGKLLRLHTWGERFGHAEACGPGSAVELEPVRDVPERASYDAAREILRVGDGTFGPVSPDLWGFEVSGLRPLGSWLGYRMAVRSGRRSSPLEEITPRRWKETPELLRLLTILEHTLALTPYAESLLERIVAGPIIETSALPTPTLAERQAPKG